MNNEIIEYDEIIEAAVKGEKKFKSVAKWVLGNKFFRILGLILMVVITVSSLWFGIKYKIKYEEVKAERDQLLAELQEDDKITDIIIEEKLEQISELSTAMFTYSGTTSKPDYRYLFNTDLKIWLSKNKVDITYEGIIKTGYDLEEVTYEIKDLTKTVEIHLPEVEVLDNYIKQNTLVFEEYNNWINPITVSEVNEKLVEITEAELLRAVEQGMYDEAEARMKNIIEQCFKDFTEYNIVFI